MRRTGFTGGPKKPNRRKEKPEMSKRWDPLPVLGDKDRRWQFPEPESRGNLTEGGTRGGCPGSGGRQGDTDSRTFCLPVLGWRPHWPLPAPRHPGQEAGERPREVSPASTEQSPGRGHKAQPTRTRCPCGGGETSAPGRERAERVKAKVR